MRAGEKINVSAVSYLNSKPFIYGLMHSDIIHRINLSLDTPAECAARMISREAAIGLVPVAGISSIENARIITDYCIGADGDVGSVLLLSECPPDKIKTILLDYQSRTSVLLVQVLAEKFWKINPAFIAASEGFENKIAGETAAVIIGDRALERKQAYPYVYDLAGEWKKYTKLPFVFACWVANTELPKDFEDAFGNALTSGIENMDELIRELKSQPGYYPDSENYLKKNISYHLNEEKRKGMALFLEMIS